MSLTIETDLEHLWEFAQTLNGSPIPDTRITEEEFVAWCPEELRAEWVDGEVFLMAPANFDHEDINTWLISITHTFVETKKLGQVLGNNYFVRLTQQLRLPDVMFVSKERRDSFKRTRFDGAPDLIMEVISPDSRNRDRRDKFIKYEQDGVREYWIIDPIMESIDLYTLVDGRFQEVKPVGGKYQSKVLPGYFLKLDWLTSEQRPDPLAIFHEFGLI